MIQRSQREKVLIIASAILLFVLVTYVTWGPLLRSWRTTWSQSEAKKQELVRVKTTVAKKPELDREYQKLAEAMAGGPSLVPDVLVKVEALARSAGVNIINRRPQQPNNKGGFTEVPIECSMEATIDTLVKFLYDVKSAQDLLDIAELKITPTPQDPTKLRAEVRVVSLRSK